MKKTVGFFAAAVLGTMMMSMPVSADQTINNGATGSTTDTADMTVTGIVGAMANTDPNENIPDGDARWINVTLPTSALFNSNPATSNATLMAPDYAIKNNSGRPVRVALNDVKNNSQTTIKAVKNVTLEGKTHGKTTQDIILDGVPQSPSAPVKLADLGDNQGKINGQDVSDTFSFTFTGNVDTTLLGTTKETVDYGLTFKFTPLKSDGTIA